MIMLARSTMVIFQSREKQKPRTIPKDGARGVNNMNFHIQYSKTIDAVKRGKNNQAKARLPRPCLEVQLPTRCDLGGTLCRLPALLCYFFVLMMHIFSNY